MPSRVGFKRVPRNHMRISTTNYIRFISALVVVAIFVSEGSLRELSEAQSKVVTPRSTTLTPDGFPANPKAVDRGERDSQSAAKLAVSSLKVARTLQELLQEAVPERIFGLGQSNGINLDASTLQGNVVSNDTLLNPSARTETLVSSRPLDANIPRKEHANSSAGSTLEDGLKAKSSLNESDISRYKEARRRMAHTPFKGVLPTEQNKHLFAMDNITHLSFMLYRLIKTHNIERVLDVPCKSSILWIGDLIQVLEFEVPRFHYKCLAPDDRSLAEGVLRFENLSSVTVLKNERPWSSKLPKVDLALCWYGLGYYPPHQSWSLVKGLRAAGVNFALVPNYPEVRHNPGSGSRLGRINVRRAPYRFNEPLRVVNNVSSVATTPKQLLFYDLEGIRTDVL